MVKRECCSKEETSGKCERIIPCFQGLESYKAWFFSLFNLSCINPLLLFEHFLHMRYRLVYCKSGSTFNIHSKSFREGYCLQLTCVYQALQLCGCAYLLNHRTVCLRQKFAPLQNSLQGHWQSLEHWLLWLSSKLSSGYWSLTFPLSTQVMMKDISD